MIPLTTRLFSHWSIPLKVVTNEKGEALGEVLTTEYISLQEMKQGQCICPLSWSVHCKFTGDGKCNKRGWACTPPPAQPNFTLMTECTPESRRYYSVYSVVLTIRRYRGRWSWMFFCYFNGLPSCIKSYLFFRY
jgi:hypothetical protein